MAGDVAMGNLGYEVSLKGAAQYRKDAKDCDEATKGFQSQLEKMVGSLGGWAPAVANVTQSAGALKESWSGAKTVGAGLSDVASSVVSGLKLIPGVGPLVTAAGKAISESWSDAKGVLAGVGKWVEGQFPGIGLAFKSLGGIGGTALDGLSKAAGGAITVLGGFVKAGYIAYDGLMSFARGVQNTIDEADELGTVLGASSAEFAGLRSQFASAGVGAEEMATKINKLANVAMTDLQTQTENAAKLQRAERDVTSEAADAKVKYQTAVRDADQALQDSFKTSAGYKNEQVLIREYQEKLNRATEDYNSTITKAQTKLQDLRGEIDLHPGKLQAYGISVTDANGKIKTSIELTYELADYIKGLSSVTEQAAVTQEIFGRGSARMLVALKDGSAGFKAAAVEAERLGLAFTDLDREHSMKFEAAAERLNEAGKGLAATFGKPLLEPLAKIGDQIVKLVANSLEWLRASGELEKFLKTIVSPLGYFADQIGELNETFGKTPDAVTGYVKVGDKLTQFHKDAGASAGGMSAAMATVATETGKAASQTAAQAGATSRVTSKTEGYIEVAGKHVNVTAMAAGAAEIQGRAQDKLTGLIGGAKRPLTELTGALDGHRDATDKAITKTGELQTKQNAMQVIIRDGKAAWEQYGPAVSTAFKTTLDVMGAVATGAKITHDTVKLWAERAGTASVESNEKTMAKIKAAWEQNNRDFITTFDYNTGGWGTAIRKLTDGIWKDVTTWGSELLAWARRLAAQIQATLGNKSQSVQSMVTQGVPVKGGEVFSSMPPGQIRSGPAMVVHGNIYQMNSGGNGGGWMGAGAAARAAAKMGM